MEVRRNNRINVQYQGMSPIGTLVLLSVIALLYTTFWDNYLVATGVWFYERNQILGILIGFVPLEEYLFFITQPLLVGAIVIWLQRYHHRNPAVSYSTSNNSVVSRIGSIIPLVIIWILALGIFLSDIPTGQYFALIVLWAFPPIMMQLWFGADILWSNRRLVVPAVLLPSTYLSIVDAYAIMNGVWTIAAETSTGILIGNILPIEEMLFFFVTNILIVFGITLISDVRSKERISRLITRIVPSTHIILGKLETT
jgi:lycopene cyclase domain-containing protein